MEEKSLSEKVLKDKIEVILKNSDTNDEDEISLIEIIETLVKGKYKILLSIIVFLIIGLFVAKFQEEEKYINTVISYNFDGVEEGLDPDGDKLDTSVIKSPSVLKEVEEDLNLTKYGLDVESLRKMLVVEPVIPGDVTKRIEKLEEAKAENSEDTEEFVYYPTRYEIKLNLNNNTIPNNKGEEILNEIVMSYQKHFYQKYSDRDLLPNVLSDMDYDVYDYPEISMMINDQLSLLYEFVENKVTASEGSEFRARSTGMTFLDIYNSVKVIDNVDVNRMDSIISSYRLTKDKNKLMKLYEYKIKQLELLNKKKEDEANIAGSMLDKFEFQRNKSILIAPGLSDTSNISESVVEEENSYYDGLVKEGTDAGVEAKNVLYDAEYYRNEIEKYEYDYIEESDKTEAIKDVLKISEDVNKKLNIWINIVNDSANEFYETNYYNSSIKKESLAETYVDTKQKLIILGISVGIGIMIGVFIVFLGQLWSGRNEGIDNKIKTNLTSEILA